MTKLELQCNSPDSFAGGKVAGCLASDTRTLCENEYANRADERRSHSQLASFYRTFALLPAYLVTMPNEFPNYWQRLRKTLDVSTPRQSRQAQAQPPIILDALL